MQVDIFGYCNEVYSIKNGNESCRSADRNSDCHADLVDNYRYTNCTFLYLVLYLVSSVHFFQISSEF